MKKERVFLRLSIRGLLYIYILRELYYKARNTLAFCSEYVGTLLYFEKKDTRMVKLLPP